MPAESRFARVIGVVQAGQARARRFSEKVFAVRNSVLTNMLLKPDFQSIENIFVAMLVWLGVNIVIQVPFDSCVLPRRVCDVACCAHAAVLRPPPLPLQEWFEHQRIVDTTIFFYAFRCAPAVFEC